MRIRIPALALLLGVPALAHAGEPTQIHLSWQNDARTTMTVQWADDGDMTGVLQFGLTPEDLSRSVDAERLITDTHTWFTAEATGLQPGTLYHYRVGDGTNFSDVARFKTAPEDPSAPYRFAVFGDSRGNYGLFGEALDIILAENPDFVVFSGDATEGGGDDEWDQWFTAGARLLREVPFMPAYGNHDAFTERYFERFALPQDAEVEEHKELYYSFVYGNAMFLSLNDNLFGPRISSLGGEQSAWLEKRLANNTSQWIFVANHQPFYSSSNKHGSSPLLQRTWGPLIDQYEVDMVFNGHDHNYERTHPLRDREVQGDMKNGTTYVVAAGVGAPLYQNGESYFTKRSESIENFVVIDIDSNRMTYTAKRLDGTTIDSFTYERPVREVKVVEPVVEEEARGVFACSAGSGSSTGMLAWLLLPLVVRAMRRLS